MAAPKGTRPPNAGKGRRKGVPNKVTQLAKDAIAAFCEDNAAELQGWLKRISRQKRFGAQAAIDTYLRVLEYHLPKLGRVEHTGKDGGELTVTIKAEPLDENL
jgi:hypothetical protein